MYLGWIVWNYPYLVIFDKWSIKSEFYMVQPNNSCSRNNCGKSRIIFKILKSYAAAAAKSLQSCPTLCDPIDGSPPGSPPSLGFSRQEHWSGLPFHSTMHEVKSESEVAQSCPTLRDPMSCSLPGSSIHGIFQAIYMHIYRSFRIDLEFVLLFLEAIQSQMALLLVH